MKAWDKIRNFFMPEIEDEFYEEDVVKEDEKTVARPVSVKSESVEQQVVNGGSVRVSHTYAGPEPVVVRPVNYNNVVKMQPKKAVQELKITVYAPKKFDDVRSIADDIRAKKAAVVNYDCVDAELQRRICDFMNGACYVLDGEVRRISTTMVLYVPTGVSVGDITVF